MTSSLFLTSFLIILFFFNDTATTEIYTLSLHDALPISRWRLAHAQIISKSPVVPGYNLRSEEHTSELQSHSDLVCRLLLEKKKDVEVGPPVRQPVDQPRVAVHREDDRLVLGEKSVEVAV